MSNRRSRTTRPRRRILLLTGIAMALAVVGGAANAADTGGPDIAATARTTHLAPAAPGAASPTCYSQGCADKQAAATNCQSDAIPIAGWQNTVGTQVVNNATLLYSPSCAATWGEYDTYHGATVGTSRYQLWTQAPNGAGVETEAVTIGDNQTSITTPMKPWSGSVKFCVNWSGNDDDPAPTGGQSNNGVCTKWR